MEDKLKKTLEKVVGKITHDPASDTYNFQMLDKEYRITYDPIGDAYVITESKPQKTLEQIRAEIEAEQARTASIKHPCWVPPSQIDEKELKRIIELERNG